jgi:hypothetical protein
MFTVMETGDGSPAAVAANKVALLEKISALKMDDAVLGQFEGYLDDETARARPGGAVTRPWRSPS